jgi:hypothetical protein
MYLKKIFVASAMVATLAAGGTTFAAPGNNQGNPPVRVTNNANYNSVDNMYKQDMDGWWQKLTKEQRMEILNWQRSDITVRRRIERLYRDQKDLNKWNSMNNAERTYFTIHTDSQGNIH